MHYYNIIRRKQAHSDESDSKAELDTKEEAKGASVSDKEPPNTILKEDDFDQIDDDGFEEEYDYDEQDFNEDDDFRYSDL